jgi:hypothetical protein
VTTPFFKACTLPHSTFEQSHFVTHPPPCKTLDIVLQELYTSGIFSCRFGCGAKTFGHDVGDQVGITQQALNIFKGGQFLSLHVQLESMNG